MNSPCLTPLLAEYRRALGYDRVRAIHRMSGGKIEEVVERFRRFGTIVEPTEVIDTVKEDQDDNRVLECAVEAEADCVVSGDKHLRALGSFRRIRILSPAEFLEYLDEVESLP